MEENPPAERRGTPREPSEASAHHEAGYKVIVFGLGRFGTAIGCPAAATNRGDQVAAATSTAVNAMTTMNMIDSIDNVVRSSFANAGSSGCCSRRGRSRKWL